MTVASEIQKLQTNLSDSYSACEEKGATLPEQQNFDNLPATISSISGGVDPSEYTKYGITINDLWYSFPNACSVFDANAPHCDMSSAAGTSNNYRSAYMFYSARVKSVNAYNNNGSNLGQYSYWTTFNNNKCVQYVRLTRTGDINSSYGFYAPCQHATNVKVLVYNFPKATNITATYNAYMFGSQSSNSYKIRSARLDNLINITSSSAASYIGGRNKNLQTLWLPDLEGVGATNSTNSHMQYTLYDCTGVIGFFAPKLKQIGYTATNSNYKQMGSFISTSSTKFPYLYLPALETIYNVSTTASNGTFASSTGLKKVYLPAVSIIGGSGGKNIFNGCSNLIEIHFGKKNQSVIEATDGYATLWGRGAGNATVYFDLINEIVVNGKTYKRTQYNDYMTDLTYNGKVYYRSDADRDSHNIDWKFWAWKSTDGAIVYTQNPLSLPTEYVWEYISGDNWDYNDLGQLTENDWRYGWTNVDDETDIIYTTNQFTPAVGDQTYTVSADGKSFVENATITEVI